jgi:hypothetical protein
MRARRICASVAVDRQRLTDELRQPRQRFAVGQLSTSKMTPQPGSSLPSSSTVSSVYISTSANIAAIACDAGRRASGVLIGARRVAQVVEDGHG